MVSKFLLQFEWIFFIGNTNYMPIKHDFWTEKIMKPIFTEEQSSNRLSVTLWRSGNTGFCFSVERDPSAQQSGAAVWAAPTDRQALPEVHLLMLRNHHKGWVSPGAYTPGLQWSLMKTEGNSELIRIVVRDTHSGGRDSGLLCETSVPGDQEEICLLMMNSEGRCEKSPGLHFWDLDSCKVRHCI